MNHPNSLRLESFACGEPNASVESHVDECSECRTFVAGIRAALTRGPSRVDAERAVARAARRHAPSRTRLWTGASVAAPLAAAAALLFFLHGPKTPEPTASTPATSEPVALVAPSVEPTTTFKGGIQVAVVRERGGNQARFAGRVAVRPGDRLRVEVALDQEQDILAAIMGEDGSWLELMPQGARSSGTHFSDRSARVDASPLRGTVVVGSPDAMKRAKETKDASGLATIRIDWEAP